MAVIMGHVISPAVLNCAFRPRYGRMQRIDKSLPHKTAPAGVRPARYVPLILKEVIILIIAALGYSQHAKPYCSGLHHSLPPDSSVLSRFPCDAGAFRRALYLLRNIYGVYHDMFRLGPADRWASFQMAIVVLRIVFQLLLSARAYQRLATCFFSQVHRLIPLGYLLAVSYVGIAPSPSAQWYITNQPALDFFSNILFPVNPVAECVYGAVNILLIIAIWWRCGVLATNSLETGPTGLGTTSRVVTGNITTIPAANGSFSGSPYHSGMWLPFQLLLSAACTMATVFLERWRSHPAVPRNIGLGIDQPRAEWPPYGEHPGLACGPPGETSNGDSATEGNRSDGGGIGKKPGPALNLRLRQANNHRSSVAAFRPGTYPAAREPTPSAGAARHRQQNQQDTYAGMMRALPQVGNPQTNTAASGNPDGAGTLSKYAATGAHGDQSSGGRNSGGVSDGDRAMDSSNEQGGIGIATVEPAVDIYHGIGIPTGSEREEDMASQVITEIEGLQCTNGGLRVPTAPASSSAVASEGHDSGLTEGFMLNLLGGPDLVTHLDEADESMGVVNGLSSWTTDTHGGELLRNGSSRTTDVARLDQQQRAQSQAQEDAAGGTAVGAAAAATGVTAGGPSDSESLASAGAHTVNSGPVSATEAGSDDGRGHGQGNLLRSLSSQAHEPRGGGVLQAVPYDSPLPGVSGQEADRHPQADQVISARLPAQQPVQANLGRDQQQVRMSGNSEGGISTAAVMAAVRQSRRPAYVPRVRIVTTHIKVQGAHPEQLQSGYSQRLEHVASAAGHRLMGVYVRAGCIELVLDSADWGDAKSEEGDEASSDPPRAQASGRDSGPLPTPLQPRPVVQPLYRSAPNTPSRLQRRQMQQSVGFPPQSRPSSGQALPLPLQAAHEPVLASPGSTGSCDSAALAGPSALSAAGAAQRSNAVTGATGHCWSYVGGGSRGSLQGGATALAGGGNGGNGGNGCGTGVGADLDLGAVIRALRLNRAEGSADSTNDLASELDMDLDYMGGVEMAALAPSSGVSGEDAGSKEAPSGASARRGDYVVTGAAVPGLAATSDPAVGASPQQQGQQPYQQQQVQRHVPLQQVEQAPPAIMGQPEPSPPPLHQYQQQQPAILRNVGSISRQALVLGGQRDPLAPGIVSLHPRVFVTGPSAATGAPAAAPMPRDTDTSAQVIVTSVGSDHVLGPADAAYYNSFGAAPPVMRFSAVVRRVGGVPAAPVAAMRLGTFGSAPVGSAAAGAGTSVAPGAAEPEFTIRARGEYLPIRVSRMSSPAASAMTMSASLARQGSLPLHGVDVSSDSGSGGVLSEILGLAEAVQDTSKDMDTGTFGDGQRTSPSWVWHESYMLELLDAPQTPGLLLADLRGNGTGPSAPCAVPLVAMSDLAAAAELQAVVERWEGSPSELDDLLLDLGTWLHHTVLPQVGPVPAAGVLALPRLDGRLAALGRHLLSYAEVCGWAATAASLRDDLRTYGISTDVYGCAPDGDSGGVSPWTTPPAVVADSPKAVVSAAAEVTAAGSRVSRPAPAPAPAPAQQPERLEPARTKGGPAPHVAGERFGALWRRVPLGWRPWALSEWAAAGVGGGEPCDGKDTQDFREFEHACKSSQIWVMTVLDVVCLLALLYRGRSESLVAPSNITTLIACCCGAATAVARLLMPYQRWLRIAEMFKVPRHICYGITKALIAFGGFPAPPGIAAYELGLPVFVFESIVVPWSCLMSIRTAVAVCTAKLPLYLSLWHHLIWTALWDEQSGRLCTVDQPDCLGRVGLEPDQAAALIALLPLRFRLLRGLALCVLFVSVTAACHASIRMSYRRSKRLRSLAASRSPSGFLSPGVQAPAATGNATRGGGLEVEPRAKGRKAD